MFVLVAEVGGGGGGGSGTFCSIIPDVLLSQINCTAEVQGMTRRERFKRAHTRYSHSSSIAPKTPHAPGQCNRGLNVRMGMESYCLSAQRVDPGDGNSPAAPAGT